MEDKLSSAKVVGGSLQFSAHVMYKGTPEELEKVMTRVKTAENIPGSRIAGELLTDGRLIVTLHVQHDVDQETINQFNEMDANGGGNETILDEFFRAGHQNFTEC